jgi:2-polyprenyl-3-methyl-5-hydroxy-6-metoxy-1,4-benzoquinol methylase
MKENRLNIIAVENGPTSPNTPPVTLQKKRREEAKAKFERLWLIEPEKFDPLRNSMERERMQRTWNLMIDHFNPEEKQIADLGCGSGVLAKKLAEHKAKVHAIDIASNALKLIEQSKVAHLTTAQDYVPRTMLKDDFYDVVISTELIANLPADEFRLYFSELSRIMTPKGFVVCSTPIDFTSEDALQRFASLAETEFKIEKWVFSYHYLYIKLLNFLKAPSHFVKAKNDPEYRQRELSEKSSISHWWFKLNSKMIPAALWTPVAFVLKPFVKFFQQNHFTLNILEKVSRFIWSESAISHVIFMGTRRPLVSHMPEEEQPVERKQRKQVWE